MIPKVKTWIVTVEGGAKHEITAPTRYLARLNFRDLFVKREVGHQPIKSIGVKRAKKGGKNAN